MFNFAWKSYFRRQKHFYQLFDLRFKTQKQKKYSIILWSLHITFLSLFFFYFFRSYTFWMFFSSLSLSVVDSWSTHQLSTASTHVRSKCCKIEEKPSQPMSRSLCKIILYKCGGSASSKLCRNCGTFCLTKHKIAAGLGKVVWRFTFDLSIMSLHMVPDRFASGKGFI